MLNIRRYQSADSDIVWKLHNDAIGPTGAHLGDDSWYADILHIDEVYLQNGGEYLVGESNGQVVVMGAIKRTSAERAEVRRMRVTPACQGQGFGQAMLDALEQTGERTWLYDAPPGYRRQNGRQRKGYIAKTAIRKSAGERLPTLR